MIWSTKGILKALERSFLTWIALTNGSIKDIPDCPLCRHIERYHNNDCHSYPIRRLVDKLRDETDFRCARECQEWSDSLGKWGLTHTKTRAKAKKVLARLLSIHPAWNDHTEAFFRKHLT